MRFGALAIIFFVFLASAQYSFSDTPAVWKQCAPKGATTSGDTSPPNQMCCVPSGGSVQKWTNGIAYCKSITFTLSHSPSSPVSSDKVTFTATATTSNGKIAEIWIEVDSGSGSFELSSTHKSCSPDLCTDTLTTSYMPGQSFGAGKTVRYKAWAKEAASTGSLGRTFQSLDEDFVVGTPGLDNAPDASIPQDDAWHKSDITSVITYTDDKELKSCSYEIVDGGTSRGVQPVTCSGTTTAKTVTIRVPNDCVAQGADACVLKVSVTDTKPQTTNKQEAFNIDTKGPDISSVQSTATCKGVSNKMEINSETTIKADAADLHNGVSSCAYATIGPDGFKSSGVMALKTGSSYEASFTAGAVAGDYTATIYCYDNLDNEATESLTMNIVAKGACDGGDTTPPDTIIDSAPSGTVSSTSATFSFHGTDASSPLTYECQMDGGGFLSCSSPIPYTVAVGSQTFQVRATDPAGNVDASPASATWTVSAASTTTTTTTLGGGGGDGDGGTTTTTMGGDGGTTTTTVPDFAISVNPPSGSLAAGDDMIAMVSITPSNGFSSPVHFAGAWQGASPAGSQFFYIPEDVEPPHNDAYLVILIGDSASPGTYTLRTAATGGGLTRTADLTIDVTAVPVPMAFSLSHNPPMLTVNKNPEFPATGTAEIKITPNSFDGNIALSGAWIYPVSVTGITASIVPAISTNPHGAIAVFTVQPSASKGFYVWKTSGVSGDSTTDGYLVIRVTAEPPPFIIGLDSADIGDIRYSLIEEKIVEIKDGMPFFTKGMISDFFVTGTLKGVGEAPCDPRRACFASASVNSGPPISLSWNVFENAWKGKLDTVTGECDQPMIIDVTMGTDTVSGEKTFPAFVSCAPRVAVSPVQARVALGTKNEKIFDVIVYDPMVIGTAGDKRYLVEMNPDDIDGKTPFLRHWIRIDCPKGVCQKSDATNDFLRASMLAGSVSEDVLSSDGLLRAGMLPTNAARGKYETRAYLNGNGAQMAGTYNYVFSARASPEIQGSGTLSVYSEGLSEMSTLQLMGALVVAAVLRRKVRK